MRITNNMISSNAKNNINATKVLVDKYNTQMTTQKKISKASDDPVIAIRSLRLSTSLSHINQYVDNNIPDASSWLDVTETALNNMITILTDVRTQCVNGSTDTLTTEDRNVILQSLKSLQDQVYSEGNADYAGRTVFTGYRTSSKLTFMTDQTDTSYEITQKFTTDDVEDFRYYTEGVTVPTSIDGNTPNCTTDVTEYSYQRLRLGYGNTTDQVSLKINGNDTAFTSYENMSDFDPASLGDDQIAYIQETGEFIFGKNAGKDLVDQNSDVEVTYTKTGFEASDVRPEYYYDCKDITGGQEIVYTFGDQPINFTVANNTDVPVNTQASEILSPNIKRDVDQLVDIVQTSLNAQKKVDDIKSMMKEERYSDKDSQAKLQTYLDSAQKELDYANDNMRKTYAQYVTNFDGYMKDVNLAITDVGSTESRISLIKTRIENQQSTIEELKSSNEDRDISDIIIDYYAMYNAYQSSLTAASKIGERSLLDYL